MSREITDRSLRHIDDLAGGERCGDGRRVVDLDLVIQCVGDIRPVEGHRLGNSGRGVGWALQRRSGKRIDRQDGATCDAAVRAGNADRCRVRDGGRGHREGSARRAGIDRDTAGTVAAAESSDSVTTAPPDGAAALRVTVPVDEAPPTTVVGLSDSDVRVTVEARVIPSAANSVVSPRVAVICAVVLPTRGTWSR